MRYECPTISDDTARRTEPSGSTHSVALLRSRPASASSETCCHVRIRSKLRLKRIGVGAVVYSAYAASQLPSGNLAMRVQLELSDSRTTGSADQVMGS